MEVMRREQALVWITIAFAAANAPGASAATPRSGLYGVVTRGPITPVCRVGVPCDGPAPNVTLTFTRAGFVQTTKTNQRGAYRLELPAGTYTVRTSARPFGQTPRPANVRVRSHQVDKIDFSIDTGIR